MRFDVSDIPGFGELDIAEAYEWWVFECPWHSTFVEVGNFHGRSLVYLAKCAKEVAKDIRIFGVDHGRGMFADGSQPTAGELRRNVDRHGVADVVTLITADSVEAAKQFEDESCWLVFLDDDHTREGFEASFRAWYPKVKTGGVFCGHDIKWHTVWEPLAELYPERGHGPTINCWNIRKQKDRPLPEPK